MNIIRNILAVVGGWLGGSLVNMGLVVTGHSVFPIEGLDPNDMEALAEVMPTLSAKYMVFPFLAHAVGTLVGAFLAAVIAANRKMTFALVIGGLFFIGGIMAAMWIPSSTGFVILDLVVAYVPMAWIGGKLGSRIGKKG